MHVLSLMILIDNYPHFKQIFPLSSAYFWLSGISLVKIFILRNYSFEEKQIYSELK
jgi:hypothetical protein